MPTTAIPLSKFGKDHWSTFAYLETVHVDFKGVIDRRRLRCDPDLHPGLAHQASGDKKYPTRLRFDEQKQAFEEVQDHDDWSCFEDLEREGLCTWRGTGINPVVRLTPYGEKVAGVLRAFKAQGGSFCNFVPPVKG
jgi:hypothetical protein